VFLAPCDQFFFPFYAMYFGRSAECCSRIKVDLSIFQAGSGSDLFRPGRVRTGLKFFCYFGLKKSCHDHPVRIGPQFLVKPGLGRATCIFYSVKQLKTTIRARLGQKNFAGFEISAHARPVRFLARLGAGRAGVKMLRYKLKHVLDKTAPSCSSGGN
jgi:hypothetical protein